MCNSSIRRKHRRVPLFFFNSLDDCNFNMCGKQLNWHPRSGKHPKGIVRSQGALWELVPRGKGWVILNKRGCPKDKWCKVELSWDGTRTQYATVSVEHRDPTQWMIVQPNGGCQNTETNKVCLACPRPKDGLCPRFFGADLCNDNGNANYIVNDNGNGDVNDNAIDNANDNGNSNDNDNANTNDEDSAHANVNDSAMDQENDNAKDNNNDDATDIDNDNTSD